THPRSPRLPPTGPAAGELAGNPRRGDPPVRRGLYPRRREEQRRQLQQLLQARLEALLPEVVRRAAGFGRSPVPANGGLAEIDPQREGGDVRAAAARQQTQSAS